MRRITFLTFILILSLCTLSAASIQNYYLIRLTYTHGDIKYDSTEITPTPGRNSEGGDEHAAEIISFDNQILNITFFTFPLEVFYDTVDPETGEINGGNSFIRNESTTTLYLPYYPNAKEINIYDQNLTLKLRIPVQQFAKEKNVEARITNQQQVKPNQDGETTTPRNITIPIIAGIILILILSAAFALFKIKRTH